MTIPLETILAPPLVESPRQHSRPCFCNLSISGEISKGCLIADIPAIVGSLDFVMGEVDR